MDLDDLDEEIDSVNARFGGVDRFKELAHRTHNRMLENPKLFQFFPPTIKLDPIVEKNAEFMQGFFGGKRYEGSGIKSSHTFLHISDAQYDVFMDIAKEEVASMCAGDKELEKELLEGIEKMRYEIVENSSRQPKSNDAKKGKKKQQKPKPSNEEQSSTAGKDQSKGKEKRQEISEPASSSPPKASPVSISQLDVGLAKLLVGLSSTPTQLSHLDYIVRPSGSRPRVRIHL
mmetsp:Transcript_15171/g.34575  ORF Transcript_15171/g.34575 Transcript_15171/m.34575 type:complete len:231 (-) Transcript_15171:68-760(-)